MAENDPLSQAAQEQLDLNRQTAQDLIDFFFSTIFPITEKNKAEFLDAIRKINKFRRRADKIRRKRLRQGIELQKQTIQEIKDIFQPSIDLRNQAVQGLLGIGQSIFQNIPQDRLFGRFKNTPFKV